MGEIQVYRKAQGADDNTYALVDEVADSVGSVIDTGVSNGDYTYQARWLQRASTPVNSTVQAGPPRYFAGNTDNPSIYNYYEYRPEGTLIDGSVKYPVYLFQHGLGEGSNSKPFSGMLTAGLPMVINAGYDIPMLMFAPQDGSWFVPSETDSFIEYLKTLPYVDPTRIYIGGLSGGWERAISYITESAAYADKIAACFGCSGSLNPYDSSNDITNMQNTPVWIFHGEADGTRNVGSSNNFKVQVDAEYGGGSQTKRSTFPGGGHNNTFWNNVFNQSYLNNVNWNGDPWDTDIYNWLLQFDNT
jgi:predicted peptidase